MSLWGGPVRITNDGLKDLSQGLEKLSSLKALVLRFQGYGEKVTDVGLSHLKIGLEKCASLKHLELGFQSYFNLFL